MSDELGSDVPVIWDNTRWSNDNLEVREEEGGEEEVRAMSDHLRRKPGRGWTQDKITTSMWDHDSGISLHLGGYVRLLDGRIVSVNTWREHLEFSLALRMAGGNRKRGLMLWALMVADAKEHR